MGNVSSPNNHIRPIALNMSNVGYMPQKFDSRKWKSKFFVISKFRNKAKLYSRVAKTIL